MRFPENQRARRKQMSEWSEWQKLWDFIVIEGLCRDKKQRDLDTQQLFKASEYQIYIYDSSVYLKGPSLLLLYIFLFISGLYFF